jgi:hypothetical protein
MRKIRMLPGLFQKVVRFEGEKLRAWTRGIGVVRLDQGPPFVCDLRRGEGEQVSRVGIIGLCDSLLEPRVDCS